MNMKVERLFFRKQNNHFIRPKKKKGGKRDKLELVQQNCQNFEKTFMFI